MTSQSLTTHAQPGLADKAWFFEHHDAVAFQAILTPSVHLALWRRTLPLCLSRWLSSLPAEVLPDFRLQLTAPFYAERFHPYLAAMPANRMRAAFADDIARVASLYADILGVEHLRIRLECVSGDGCVLFHRDSVTHRLITTYRGAGTEWVFPNRADDARKQQDQFKGPINRLTAGNVALMKGSAADPELGVMHRSPRSNGAPPRIVLCVDAEEVTKLPPQGGCEQN